MDDNFLFKREGCPCCHSISFKRLYCRDYSCGVISDYIREYYRPYGQIDIHFFKNSQFSVLQCTQCTHIFQEYIPNETFMNVIYGNLLADDTLFEYDVKNVSLDHLHSMALTIMSIIDHFDKKPHELKLLDFGMGWGLLARIANAYGCQSYGIEISPIKKEYAIKSGVLIANENQLPTSYFDYINADQVFEHIPNPLQTLKKLVISLKDQGVIRISVPNGWNIPAILNDQNWSIPKFQSNSLNAIAPLEHINCFNEKSLTALAHHADLKIIRINCPMEITKLIKRSIKDLLKPYYSYLKNIKTLSNRGNTDLYFTKTLFQPNDQSNP